MVITEQIISCKQDFTATILFPYGCFSLKAPCLTSLSMVTELEGPSEKKKKNPLKMKVFGRTKLSTLDWEAVDKGTPPLGADAGSEMPSSLPCIRTGLRSASLSMALFSPWGVSSKDFSANFV